MTRFANGPAKGKTLMLKRAPVFLRVVVNGENIDALDQERDTATAEEKLFAYVLTENPAMCFIDGLKISGRYPLANYELVLNQPDDATMRNNSSWANWVGERVNSGNLPEFVKAHLARERSES